MVTIPKQYQKLIEMKPLLPKMVQTFFDIYGTTEIPGPQSSPEILRWAKVCGLEDVYVKDGIAWCGLTVAYCAKMAGKSYPKNPLYALNWRQFGEEVKPGGEVCGDVYIKERRNNRGLLIGGHVGIIIAEDQNYFHIGGGNQGDTTGIVRFPKSLKHWVRRPFYTNPPLGAQKFIIDSSGIATGNKVS